MLNDPYPRVSILVLLDHPHRHVRYEGPKGGSAWVSILVLLDHPHRRPARRTSRRHAHEFRSLFCWITLIGKKTGGRQKGVKKFRSLFCWITLIGRSPAPARPPRRRVSILVLLDHPHRPACGGGRSARGRRFDPCSAGSPSSARATASNASGGTRFRSLFCWITLIGLQHDNDALDWQGFRSLFCWITLFGRGRTGPVDCTAQ